jgi:hypothetical protein
MSDSKSHLISIDQALLSLSAFLQDSDRTRDISLSISEIYSIKYKNLHTRSDIDCNELVYVVNFDNEQGFAILAADDRISDDVIAVTSEGNLPQKVMNSVLDDTFNDEYPTFDGYPLTGDGFYSVDEYPDETFINPNTVDLYDSNEDDTQIGNFYINDEDSIGVNTRGDIVFQEEEQQYMFVSSLCLNYAIDEIENSTAVDTTYHDEANDIDYEPTHYKDELVIKKSEWETVCCISPLLFNSRHWHQNTPFNDLYPSRRKVFVGKKKTAPAGCFPLSIARIITYFKYPDIAIFNGYTINWDVLNTGLTYTSEFKQSASRLIYGISKSCSSWYFYEGTFTFPKKAMSCMNDLGLRNARNKDYNFARVKEMIDNSNPLIIYAIPKIRIFLAHAWNIDGYKIKARKIIETYYNEDGEKEYQTTKHDTCKMVHCDFGWGGNICNGYYVDGIFKLNSSDNEYDNKDIQTKNLKYNNLKQIILYDSPR